MLKTSTVKLFNYCSSIVAINLGNGQFRIQKLPPMVQLSSVNAIRCTDLNGDGFPDLILGGNEFGFLPQFGRLDGSFGDALINDGQGHFTFMKNARSGLNLRGQVRDIAIIKNPKNNRFLFLINDEFPVLFELASSAVKFINENHMAAPCGQIFISSALELFFFLNAYSKESIRDSIFSKL
jgi:hypothetical protein